MGRAILRGVLYAAGYVMVMTAFGMFAAPCTGSFLAASAIVADDGGPNPLLIGFFGTVAIAGFVHGYRSARSE